MISSKSTIANSLRCSESHQIIHAATGMIFSGPIRSCMANKGCSKKRDKQLVFNSTFPGFFILLIHCKRITLEGVMNPSGVSHQLHLNAEFYFTLFRTSKFCIQMRITPCFIHMRTVISADFRLYNKVGHVFCRHV